MAKVIPFKAIRPENDKVHLVASRSVDGYNSAELKDKLTQNPFSFLHVINPDFEDGAKQSLVQKKDCKNQKTFPQFC